MEGASSPMAAAAVGAPTAAQGARRRAVATRDAVGQPIAALPHRQAAQWAAARPVEAQTGAGQHGWWWAR